MLKNIWTTIKFVFTKRKALLKLKKEIWEVKDKAQKALADKKMTKAELKGILMETDDVLDLIINELLED